MGKSASTSNRASIQGFSICSGGSISALEAGEPTAGQDHAFGYKAVDECLLGRRSVIGTLLKEA